MRNFDYLKTIDALTPLHRYCNVVEICQQCDPDKSALNGRLALEWLVKAIYDMKHIEVSQRASLFELVDGQPLQDFLNDAQLLRDAHYVRKVGNRAAHTGGVTPRESFFSLINLYEFVGSVLVKLGLMADYPVFDRNLIPKKAVPFVSPKKEVPGTSSFVSTLSAEKIQPAAVAPHPKVFTEAETRKFFIDLSLRESGWEVLETKGAVYPNKACIEIPVQGMPSNSGVGYADYVLFGPDCKPLAVVEAKRTTVDAKVGQHQAKLYADCLEKQYGVRPVIYFTNGYHTEIIDGLGYPARTVYGYHTAKELELLIQRRGRKNITDLKVNTDISGREYQIRAIHHVCERLNLKHRRDLLTMATGTGKTRVSIALVELLMRNNWVKNVLFLADRISLVNQAAKNYAKLLPNCSSCILSEDDQPDMEARIMFSTYQTMINCIDHDTKDFSIGRFDLIIIDEAHRSVYGKYLGIFEYFDSLLVGLTATPSEMVERNTYELFRIDKEHSFAYDLRQAVSDGYLVDYHPIKCGTAILNNGIVFNQLSAEEKQELDKVWDYEKAKNDLSPHDDYSRDIASNEIFNYIRNIDTVDKVLQHLMTKGLKVNSGELIGKTIIFAYNHAHAQLIEERFHVLYPEYGSDFCRVIDNYEKYAQDLIDKFTERDKLPQIAVSVYMLDTGIDVPDVLNLVFFKPIYSYIRLVQMIGRGTRLSKHIFGPGLDKKFFNIYDWCSNFEFFNINPNGKEALPAKSLTERLFGLRTELAYELQSGVYQSDSACKQIHDELKAGLCQQVAKLNDTQIAVKLHWEVVDKFRKPENWVCLTPLDVTKLKEEVSPILAKDMTDEMAKQFDVLMLNIMLSKIVIGHNATKAQQTVLDICTQLHEKASIPQILNKLPVINQVLSEPFWREPHLSDLEHIRTELRDLVKFLRSTEGRRTFTVNIEDSQVHEEEAEYVVFRPYKEKVMDYLQEHLDSPVLQKIVNFEQLEKGDILELERILWKELGTKEDYEKYVKSNHSLCGDKVAAFIRTQIAVDKQKALAKYSEFLTTNPLNAMQEEYLKTIIDYVCTNGDIAMKDLIEAPSLSHMNLLGVFGEDVLSLRKFVEAMHQIIVA